MMPPNYFPRVCSEYKAQASLHPAYVLPGLITGGLPDLPCEDAWPWKLVDMDLKDETWSRIAFEDGHNSTFSTTASSTDTVKAVEDGFFEPQRRSCSIEDHQALEGKTTLMVCNLPKRSTLSRLMKVWPAVDWGYDFIYLPVRTRQRKLCYCFLNFTTPDAAKAFHKSWDGCYFSGSDVPVTVRLAHTQGLEQSVTQYRSTNFTNATACRAMLTACRAMLIQNGVPVFVEDLPEQMTFGSEPDVVNGQMWSL